MSPTTTALICGVLFPIAAWLTWRAIHPAPLTLRAVQARVAPITPTRFGVPDDGNPQSVDTFRRGRSEGWSTNGSEARCG